MHVLESACNLTDILYNALLGEVNFVLHGLLDDQLEVATLSPLHSDEKLV